MKQKHPKVAAGWFGSHVERLISAATCDAGGVNWQVSLWAQGGGTRHILVLATPASARGRDGGYQRNAALRSVAAEASG